MKLCTNCGSFIEIIKNSNQIYCDKMCQKEKTKQLQREKRKTKKFKEYRKKTRNIKKENEFAKKRRLKIKEDNFKNKEWIEKKLLGICEFCRKNYYKNYPNGLHSIYCSKDCNSKANYRRNHKKIIKRKTEWVNKNWEIIYKKRKEYYKVNKLAKKELDKSKRKHNEKPETIEYKKVWWYFNKYFDIKVTKDLYKLNKKVFKKIIKEKLK